MKPKLVASLVVAGFVVIFILQNMTVVTINLLFWSTSMSRALLVIILVGIGMLIGWLLHGHFSHKQK